jgi:hypothetical protein
MEQLFDHFSDIPALEKEKQKVLDIFEEIAQGVSRLSTLGFKIDSAKGMADLASATQQLEKVQTALSAAQKKVEEGERKLAAAEELLAKQTKESTGAAGDQAKTYKSLSGDLAQNIERQVELRNRLKDVRAEIKNLNAFSDAAKSSEAYREQISKLTEEQVRLKLELSSTERFVKNQTREFLAQEGSLDSLRAKLNQMLQAYDSFSDAQKASPQGQANLQVIQDLTDEINKQEQATKRYFRNVGNYQGSAKIIADAFERAQQRMSTMNTEAGKAGPAAQQVRKEYEALQRVMENPQFVKVAASYGDATREVRFFQKQLVQLEEQELKDTEVYKQVQARLADLTDTIADTRAEVKALSSDTRGFDLFASGIGTLASIYQTAASAAELFGASSEDVQRSIQKLMAVQNIANGVRQIATDLTTRGSAANKAYAFVQSQVSVFTNAAASAQQKWNAALKLSGIGLLITGLIYLADKMGIFGSSTDQSEKEVEKLNTELERQNEILDRNSKKLDAATKIQVEGVKAAAAAREKENLKKLEGASADEISNAKAKEKFTTEGQIRAASIAGLSREARARSAAAGATLSSIGKELQAYGLQVTGYESAQHALEDIQNRGDKKVEARLKTVVENYRRSEEAQSTIQQLNAEARSAAAGEELQNEQQQFERRQRYMDQEKKAAAELAQFRLGLLADESAVFKNADGPAAIRNNAAKKEFEYRKQALIIQRDFELSQENTTTTERILIREKAANEIRKIEEKLTLDLINIRVSSRAADTEEANRQTEEFQTREQQKINDRIETSKKFYESLTKQQQIQQSQEAEAAAQGFKNTRDGRVEYQDKLQQIDVKYQGKQLQLDIDFYKEQINILKSHGYDTIEYEQQLADAEAKLAQIKVERILEAGQKQTELLDTLKTKYQDLRGAVEQTFSDAVDGAFDKRKDQLQQEIDLIEEAKNKEIERITASVDTEESKAARIKVIEAKAQVDKERLEKKQRDLDRRKAIFDRAFKAYTITTEGIQEVAKIKLAVAELTAKAAANPLLTPLIPLAASQIPLAIATTAANLVGLLATPIPQYAKGILSSPEGPAIVGEAGRELAVDRAGNLTMYAQPTLAYLKKGTTVLPNSVTEDIIAAAESDRAGMVKNFAKAKVSVQRPDRTGEVVAQLVELNKKPTKIIIHNEPGIESSAWFWKNMKY